jgi:hypothetical protein
VLDAHLDGIAAVNTDDDDVVVVVVVVEIVGVGVVAVNDRNNANREWKETAVGGPTTTKRERRIPRENGQETGSGSGPGPGPGQRKPSKGDNEVVDTTEVVEVVEVAGVVVEVARCQKKDQSSKPRNWKAESWNPQKRSWHCRRTKSSRIGRYLGSWRGWFPVAASTWWKDKAIRSPWGWIAPFSPPTRAHQSVMRRWIPSRNKPPSVLSAS